MGRIVHGVEVVKRPAKPGVGGWRRVEPEHHP
jgi:hypothetical protein